MEVDTTSLELIIKQLFDYWSLTHFIYLILDLILVDICVSFNDMILSC